MVDAERDRWVATLDAMETVARGAGDSSFVPDAWSPADLGPIPLDLVDRARRVEQWQKAAMARVQEAKRLAASHLAALKTVPSPRPVAQSVYLDVTG